MCLFLWDTFPLPNIVIFLVSALTYNNTYMSLKYLEHFTNFIWLNFVENMNSNHIIQ